MKIETNNGKIRVGVAGAGKMGSLHLRILSELDSLFELVGAYDPIPERAKLAERYGGKGYTDYQSFMDDVDAIVLACPTSLHKKMALIAAENGVHVISEKPVAETLSDSLEMYEAFEAKGLTFTVNHVERFNPVVRTMSDILKGMEIISVEVHRCSPYDGRIYDVDVVKDLMIHDIDLVLNSVLGCSPESVNATGKPVVTSVDDYAQAIMQFHNGAYAFITASRCTEDKIRTICVHAKGAYIEGDMLRRTLTVKRCVTYEEDENPKINYTQSNIVQNLVLMDKNPLREELVNFGKAILGQEPLLNSKEQVIRTMTALDQIEACLYN